MKTTILKLILLTCIFNPYLISNVLAENSYQNSEILSPRNFCLNNKGTLTETGETQIYICCYSNTKKCLVINEQKGYSRLIQTSHVKIKN